MIEFLLTVLHYIPQHHHTRAHDANADAAAQIMPSNRAPSPKVGD